MILSKGSLGMTTSLVVSNSSWGMDIFCHQLLFISASPYSGMIRVQSVPDLAPSPDRLSLEPLFQSSYVVCLGVAAIFLALIILYFLLRGRKQ
jgi:hypothetical protein